VSNIEFTVIFAKMNLSRVRYWPAHDEIFKGRLVKVHKLNPHEVCFNSVDGALMEGGQ
jgi:hypothetical protein